MGNVRWLGALAAGFIALGFGASQASEEMIEQLTPEIVGVALDELGLPYEVEPDPRGYPMILVDVRPFPVEQFNILFFDCDTVEVACEDITLWAWYDMGGPVSEKEIFEWNDPFVGGRRWSTGYLDDENDPALIMNINATGGIGERALQILINTYIEDIFAFHDVLKVERSAEATSESDTAVSFAAMVADDFSDARDMTAFIKEYGGSSFAHTKNNATKK